MVDFRKLYEHIVHSIEKYEHIMKKEREVYKKLIPERLRLYIAKNGITKEALAKKLGVSRMQLFRWLKGENYPSSEMIKKMEKLGIIEKIE